MAFNPPRDAGERPYAHLAFLGPDLRLDAALIVLIVVGSLSALERVPLDGTTALILPTAAAYAGVDSAVSSARAVWGEIEVLHVVDRAGALVEENAERIRQAAVVLCLNGAVLHARSVWRNSPVGDALADVTVVAVGAVGSVFGEVMIDPRGGAPTTGMGWFRDVAITMPESSDQLRRTRELAGSRVALVELGPRAVARYDGRWELSDDCVVTRGGEPATL